MVTVPRYGSPNVRPNGVPSVRFPTNAPADAFGGGPAAEQVVRQNRATINDAAQLTEHQFDRANHARMLEERRALNDWEQANVFDPKTGAVTKKGKNAFGVADELSKSFDDFAKEREKGLANEYQKSAFRDLRDKRRGEVMGWASNHVGKESARVEMEEYEAGIESAKQRAAANPSAASSERAYLSLETTLRADKEGWDENRSKLEYATHERDLNARALNGMLSRNETKEARAFLYGTVQAAGQVEPGNIDLKNRPQVKNEDGSVSTVRSMSINVDGKEVLIPTVSEDGKILSDEEAVEQFRKTGRHLGVFKDADAATRYAKRLHDQQAAMLENGGIAVNLDPRDRERIEKALKTDTSREEAVAFVDKLMFGKAETTKGGDVVEPRKYTESEALAAAREKFKDDLDARQEAERIIEHNYQRQRRMEQEEYRDVVNTATDIVVRDKSLKNLPSSTLNALKAKEKLALTELATDLNKPVPTESDPEEFYELIQMATHDPEIFVNENLLLRKPRLSKAHLEFFMKEQVSISKGERAKGVEGWMKAEEVAKQHLAEIGVNTDPKKGTDDYRDYTDFMMILNRAHIAAKEANQGKELDPKNLEALFAGVLDKIRAEETHFFKGNTLTDRLRPGAKEVVFSVKEIRKDRLEAVRNHLRTANFGIAPTNEQIIDYYNAAVTGQLPVEPVNGLPQPAKRGLVLPPPSVRLPLQ